MKVKVLLFASAREIVGESSVEVDLEPNTCCSDILDALCRCYPVLAPSRNSLSVAVNRKYVRGMDPVVIGVGDEIALIPPISGG
jgi:molybdopterin converting factor subunit 1